MQLRCENCGTKYRIPDEKVQGKAFRFKCKKCGHLVQYRPEEASGKKTMEMDSANIPHKTADNMRAQGGEGLDKTMFDPNMAAKVKAAAPATKTPVAEPKPAPQQPAPQKPASDKAKPKPQVADEKQQPAKAKRQEKEAEQGQQEPQQQQPQPQQQPQTQQPQTQQAEPAKQTQEEQKRKPRMTIEGRPLAEEPKTPKATAWYVAYAGGKKGPLTVDELGRHLMDKRPAKPIFVWKAGFTDWKNIDVVEDFDETRAMLDASGSQFAPETAGEAVGSESGETGVSDDESFHDSIRSKSGDMYEKSPFRDDNRLVDSHVEQKRRAQTGQSFSDLLPSGDEKSEASYGEDKIALDELVAKEGGAIKRPEKQKKKKRKLRSARKGTKEVVLEEYMPPKKSGISPAPILFQLLLLILIIVSALALAYFKVIEIPGIENVPWLGQFFVEDTSYHDRYADERLKWEALKKEEEERAKQRAIEEKKRKEQEAKRALEAKEENKQAASKSAKRNSKRSAGGGGNPKVVEMSFTGEQKMDTEGELKTTNHDRKDLLSARTVSRILAKNKSKYRKCLRQKSGTKGQMNYQILINRRGTVVQTKLLSTEFDGSPAVKCLDNSLKKIKFPKSGGSYRHLHTFMIK